MMSIVPHNIDIHGYAHDHASMQHSGLMNVTQSQALTDVTKFFKECIDQNGLNMNDGKFIVFRLETAVGQAGHY